MAHRAGLDRAAVVAEATKLVDEEGVEQLSLGRLAERLSIKTPSLYNHVAGLPGLRHELALSCARELRDNLTRATIGRSRAEAILALADAYRAYAREYPNRYRFTLQAPAADDPQLAAIAEEILNVIYAVLRPYNLGEQNTIHAIRSLRSIVQGFVSLEVAGGFAMPVDLDDSFHWLIQLFIAGIELADTEEGKQR
ncbi:MAG TPA: WHG domain-containing protein [Ktedonobacterales bacterium]|nr:WHG domain-containing protein [Ktedonobacterales bacterium]